jgi:hypothetical protein
MALVRGKIEPDKMFCDHCHKEITGNVYHEKGIIYRCCSAGCLAYLRITYSVTPVTEMIKRDKEDGG